MFRLYVVAALAVIVTVPASVACAYWLGAQMGEQRAYSGCLATVDAIASLKPLIKRR